jgi:hypothetical protein
LGGLGWTTGSWAEGEQLLLGGDAPLESSLEQPLPPNDSQLAAPPQPVLDPAAAGGPALAASGPIAQPGVPAPAQALPATPGPAQQLALPAGPTAQSIPASAASGIIAEGFVETVEPIQKELVVETVQPALPAYFSSRLGARFLMEEMFLPQFGRFTGARMVSEPLPGSPLLQLGLGEGDLITRLDGVPVIRIQELERHILGTGVRFIRAGEQTVCRGTMFVDPYAYFPPPDCPQSICPLTGTCETMALRP